MPAYEENVYVRVRMPTTELEKDMGQFREVLTKNGKVIEEKFTNSLKKGEKQTTTIKQETKRFRMELLSLMFAGMAIDRMFSGQINRMKEMTGQTAIMDAFWTKILVEPQMELTKLKAKFLEVEDKLNTAMGGKLDPALGWGAVFIDWTAKVVEFGSQIGLTLAALEMMKKAAPGGGGVGGNAGKVAGAGLLATAGIVAAATVGGAGVVYGTKKLAESTQKVTKNAIENVTTSTLKSTGVSETTSAKAGGITGSVLGANAAAAVSMLAGPLAPAVGAGLIGDYIKKIINNSFNIDLNKQMSIFGN